MASSSPQQTSLVPGKAETPAAPKPEAKKADKKISDIGKPQAVSPLARMVEANHQIVVNQEKILKALDGIYTVLKDLNDVFHSKTGIFQVATQQAKPKQQEKAPQQADDLPADLKDLSKEDREKLVSCLGGGVRLKHFYPDKSVWTHLNFDVLEPRGYKWVKNQSDPKSSCWKKGG